MPDERTLYIEKQVALAHKFVVLAAGAAELSRDQGFSDDLWQLANELERLQLDLLKGGPRRRASLTNRA